MIINLLFVICGILLSGASKVCIGAVLRHLIHLIHENFRQIPLRKPDSYCSINKQVSIPGGTFWMGTQYYVGPKLVRPNPPDGGAIRSKTAVEYVKLSKDEVELFLTPNEYT
jgi:hypothetical protein